MKHIMLYENYTTLQRVDDLLDKISKYGIKSLTKLEKDFLDSYKSGNPEELHKILTKEESEKAFEDDMGYFRFELETIKDYGNEKHYIGILECPSIELEDEKIPGRLNGKIIVNNNGVLIPDFSFDTESGEKYEVFDFCEGLEYELDSFLDYDVYELQNEN